VVRFGGWVSGWRRVWEVSKSRGEHLVKE